MVLNGTRVFLMILVLVSLMATGEVPFRYGLWDREVHGFEDPGGVAIDEHGVIYVADRGRALIFRVTDGEPQAWSEAGHLHYPTDIDRSGELLYVADAGLHRVVVFDREGRKHRQWGTHGTGPGMFSAPSGITVTTNRVYVADRGNNRVQVFDLQGQLLHGIGSFGHGEGQFFQPTDVAVDTRGFCYVSDAGNHRIQVFDENGRFLRQWGQWGPFPGFYDQPSSLRMIGDRLHVLDRRNHRVQVTDLEGSVTERWGAHELIPHEGRGRLHYPTYHAVAPDGSFAVLAEPIENRLQIINAVTPDTELEELKTQARQKRTHFGRYPAIDGNLLTIVEPENHFVFVFDIRPEVPVNINRFGERGNGFGLMNKTLFATPDLKGRQILTADAGSRRLQFFAMDYDPAAKTIYRPFMMAFTRAIDFDRLGRQIRADWPLRPDIARWSPDGRLYLLDGRNARIFVFDDQLRLLHQWGGHGQKKGRFMQPADLAFGSGGKKVYVTDPMAGRIVVFNARGRHRKTWDREKVPELRRPFGIAVGQDGTVYVSDSGAHKVFALDRKGRVRHGWGGKGTDMGQLWQPTGLALDDQERLFVIDYGNHRGQIFNTKGEWLVTFGSGRAYTRKSPPRKQPGRKKQ